MKLYSIYLNVIFFFAVMAPLQAVTVIKNQSYPAGQKILVGIENGIIENGLKIQVLKDGVPLAGEQVQFRIIHQPGEGASISVAKVVTDKEGKAAATLQLGKKPGDYSIAVFHKNGLETEPVEIIVRAYRSSWIFFLVLGMLGGLAIFLFGMDFSAEGLQKAAGDKMRIILGKLTNNRVMGVVVGTLTTAAIQSSSATSVMVIGFVTSTLMTLTQAIGVIYGANIGTTLTVQLIAFNVTEYSPLMLAIGFGLMLSGGGKSQFLKFIGQIIMGFGFIFFGMGLMSESMNPLRSIPAFTNLLSELGDRPFMGILIATVFTAIIQSSGAVIGISIALAFQGILTLPAAIVISLGANIGTTATALLGSINASREGKRVALVHLIFNTGGVILIFPFLNQYTGFVVWVTGLMGEGSTSREIANAHMFFNIAATIVFLPLVDPLARLVTWLIPEEKDKKVKFHPQYLVGEITSVSICLEQVFRELERTGEIAHGILNRISSLLDAGDHLAVREEINIECEKVFILEKAIKDYLARLVRESLTPEQSQESAFFLHYADSLRRLADAVGKDLLVVMEKVNSAVGLLKPEQRAELLNFQGHTLELFDKNALSFHEKTIVHAEEAGLLYKKLKILAKKLQSQNLEKSLQAGDEGQIAVYLDILDALRNEASHVHRIIQAILENG